MTCLISHFTLAYEGLDGSTLRSAHLYRERSNGQVLVFYTRHPNLA